MNPQLYQSIKLLEMPIVDLREKIEQEMERNPALEIIEDSRTVLLNEADIQRRKKHESLKATSNSGRRSRQVSEEHRRFIEGALTRPVTLQEHLLWQLQLEPVDEELRAVAETLIQNLDNDGFHIEKPETLFPAPQSQLLKAMELVRGLEPAGTCTDNYRESLEVQAGLKKDAPPGLEKALDNLELLEREKYTQLAKKTGLSEDDARLICKYIKKLFPFPGRAFAPAPVRYVVPEIKVVRDNDEFTIILNDEAFPVLGVNRFYKKLSDSEAANKAADEARDFARENIREARLFIEQLNRRNRTLIRVANAVLEFQREFFLNGPRYLAPLTLKDIANELNIHETTVSRIANGKYMQTEWGILEIRYFFTNSISGTSSNSSGISKESVKEMIKEIISVENRLLSDQDISALLSQKGIALARRTVAKYRKELDMGSSYTRKVREIKTGGSK